MKWFIDAAALLVFGAGVASLTVHTPRLWTFSACRHPRSAAGSCLYFYFHSTSAMKEKTTNTNNIVTVQKDDKSQIAGLKPKRKQTPDRLKSYAAAQKPHNF